MASTQIPSIPATAIVVTETCYICPYKATDAAALAAAANDPGVSQFMRNRFSSPYTLEDAHFFIDKIASVDIPRVNFAVFKPDGTFAGGIGLVPRADIEHRTFEIGYWIGRQSWGQGIATSSVEGLSRWAFGAFPDVLRLEACVFGPNIGSMRVLEKCGYVKEGVMRQGYCKNGIVEDKLVYSLLKQDCESLN